MKGYDACVFPREGEPALVCLEASAEDAARTAWTGDVRFLQGYARDDPAAARAHARLAAEAARGSDGRPRALARHAGSDRMVGEPTTFTHDWFHAFGRTSPTRRRSSHARARSRPSRSSSACGSRTRSRGGDGDAVRGVIRGMKEARPPRMAASSTARAPAGGRSSSRSASARLAGPGSGPSPRPATRPSGASRRCSRSGSAPTATGRPHEEPLARASCAPVPELEEGWSASTSARSALPRRASLAGSTRCRARSRVGYPGQPRTPICHGVGARAHEPPYAHQAGGGDVAEGMVLAVEPGSTGMAAAVSASRTTPSSPRRRREALVLPGRSGRVRT
jgi:hypothetical protein